MFMELLKSCRTIRRFDQSKRIDIADLQSMIEAVRLSPSPRNRQALKFILIHTEENCNTVFPFLSWAAAIKNWNGPHKGEQPAAYIIILGDNSFIERGKNTYHEVSAGIASLSIVLRARELGYGSCIIAGIQRNALRDFFLIGKQFEILLVIALGVPNETVVLENMPLNGSYHYWRDENDIHHVPKRSLSELILSTC